MPRNIDPSSITTGTGLAADDSIESNALVSPTGGNDGLRVHIQDPSRAHMARAIGVEDAASNFSSDHVEGALAELAGAGSAGRLNGLVEGGTFAASSGLTFELDATTTVLLTGTLYDFSGQQVALTDGVTNYVYIDSAGTLSASTSLPTLDSEPILIAEVTTVAGAIDSSRDLRFFVFNLDRKDSLIVRSSGSSFNQRSEANFLTMEAALTYLSLYAGSGGADEAETHRIIVRGEHRFTSGISLPVRGTILEGDGTGVLVADSPISLVIANAEDCIIRNLRIVADTTNATGIWLNQSGCAVENCSIEAGSQQWARGIRVSDDISHIRDTFIEAEDVGLEFPSGTVLTQGHYENLVIQGNRAASSLGIDLFGDFSNQSRDFQFNNVRVTGFETGLDSVYMNDYTLTDCVFEDVDFGLDFLTGERIHMNNCRVSISSASTTTSSISGIIFDVDYGTITGCHIESLRTTYTGVFPAMVGVEMEGTQNKITNSRVEGFFNTNSLIGVGIRLGQPQSAAIGCTVIGGSEGIRVQSAADDAVVSGCTILDNSETGINTSAGSERVAISDCRVVLNDNGRIGISSISDDSTITNCHFETNRTTYSGGEFIAGIYIQASNVVISGCVIRNFLNTADDSGRGIYLSGVKNNIKVRDCTIVDAQIGIDVNSTVTEGVQINDCTITGVETGIQVPESEKGHVRGCNITCDPNRGLTGITIGSTGGFDFTIADCTITLDRSSWTGVTSVPYGIYIQDDTVQVSDNRIEGFYNSNVVDGYGIRTVDNDLVVTGNIIKSCHKGVVVEPVDNNIYTNFLISDNLIDGGNGEGSIGIGILGFEDGIIRRVTITGNIVRRTNDQGIYVLGEVLRGSISNNQIDANTPLDFQNPTATGILLDSISAFFSVPRDLTISGNEISRGASGIVCKGVREADAIKSLAITGNVVSYCGIAWDGTGNGEEEFDNISRGIHVLYGEQVSITGNTLHDIGASTDNGLLPDGDTTTVPNGIRVELCTQASITNNVLEDFKSQGNLGEGSGIFVVEWNATVARHENEDTLIANNTIRSVGDYGIRIDVQEGSISPIQHVVRNMKVIGNVIRDCVINSILVSSGDEISPGNDSVIENLTIENNQSYNLTGTSDLATMTVTLSGVQAGDTFTIANLNEGPDVTFTALSGPPAVGSADFDISGTDAADAAALADAINLDSNWGERYLRPVYAEASGNVVTVYLLAEGQIGGNAWNVSSSNGTRLNLSTGIITSSIGNSVDGPAHIHLDSRDAGFMERVRVAGNMLQGGANEGFTGIRLRSRGNAASSTVRNFTLADNHIDGESVNNTAGITFQTTSGASAFQNTEIRNNEIRRLTRGGIQVWNDLNADFQDFTIKGNRFEDCSWCGIALQFNEPTQNLTVSDNDFFPSDRSLANDSQGVCISFGILGTTFSGNSALTGGQFNNNRLDKLDRHGFRLISFRDEAGTANTMKDFKEITFNGNSLRTLGGTDEEGYPAYFQFSGGGHNMSFNDNHFFSCGSDDLWANLWIEAIGLAKTYDNIEVRGNSFRDSPGGGIRIDFLDLLNSNDPDSVQNLIVDDNHLQNMGPPNLNLNGIHLSGGDGTTHNGVSLSNNIIEGDRGGNLLDHGIYFAAAQAESLVALTVSNNTLRNLDAYGIFVNGSETDGITNRSFRFCENTISQTGSGGILLTAFASGTSGSPGSRMGMRNCLIQNNIIGGTGTNGGGHGVYIRWEPDLDAAGGDIGFYYLTVSGNIVRSHGVNAGYSHVGTAFSPEPGGDHGFNFRIVADAKAWTITGNQAVDNAGYGFWFNIGVDGELERAGLNPTDLKAHAGTISAPIVITNNIAEDNDQGAASGATNKAGGGGTLQVGAYGDNWNADNNANGTAGSPIPDDGVCTMNTCTIPAGGSPNNRSWKDITNNTWLGFEDWNDGASDQEWNKIY